MAETRIREALELLRERGWFKPSTPAWTGDLCMYTATGRLACGRSLTADVEAMAGVVNEHFPERTQHMNNVGVVIFRFNDHPDTTFADVELVMEKAAVMREESVDG